MMRDSIRPSSVAAWLAAFAAFGIAGAAAADVAPAKTRVLLVTGGHAFEQEPFLEVFRSFDDVTFQWREHPNAQEMFRPERAGGTDVVVMYDMWQRIADQAKRDLLELPRSGKGLVILHHAIANYNEWDEYARLVGARYHLKPRVIDGVEKARSQWKHGVKFRVKIADPSHPITRGMSDFEIEDETYNLFDVLPGARPLLTTEEPTSGPTLSWWREQGRSRIFYLQLGHDHLAYENPNFRTLVHRAILWSARKLNP